MGYTINRPPRDGHMAFVRSPLFIAFALKALKNGKSLLAAGIKDVKGQFFKGEFMLGSRIRKGHQI